MSDSLRKDFSTKAEEAVKPDSQKSTIDSLKEAATDKLDSITGKAQEQTGDKSYLQQASDKVSSALGGSSNN